MNIFSEYIKKDCYNFILPCGLGDTLFICGFLDNIKASLEKNKKACNIHLIVKPAHATILELYKYICLHRDEILRYLATKQRYYKEICYNKKH